VGPRGEDESAGNAKLQILHHFAVFGPTNVLLIVVAHLANVGLINDRRESTTRIGGDRAVRTEGQRVKYWIDTEFIERPYAIDLISVGLVAEDGREFYAESSEVDWSKASRWTLDNVRPQLEGKGLRRVEIG
jgi:hypothetical protein